MSERQHERIDISVGVILRIDGEVIPCLSRNVSAGGMSVVTPKRWPIDTMFNLEVVLDSKHLNTVARVANHSPFGMGFEFIEPDIEFEAAIAELIEKHIPVGTGTAIEAPPLTKVKVEWAQKPLGEARRQPLKRFEAHFIDLSLDGAAVDSTERPDVGDDLIILLLDDYKPLKDPAGPLWSEAKVVRLTEHGFAMRFVSPGVNFRRAVTAIRRASR